MPNNDPGLWRAIHDALEHLWPHIYATVVSFVIALSRALLAGGKFSRSLLEAMLCGSLTLSVFPVLDYFGLNANLAVAVGSGIAFLGVEWLRSHLSDAATKLIERWTNK